MFWISVKEKSVKGIYASASQNIYAYLNLHTQFSRFEITKYTLKLTSCTDNIINKRHVTCKYKTILSYAYILNHVKRI